MDKGAHFFKCDFQVHTPRDIRWAGGDAITDEERKIYAEELVLACRAKGLGAIAITDHHDFAFFRHVKEAAENERDNTGNYYNPKDKLVVFPGIELTFAQPAACQAIMILDADFPPDQFIRILNKLSINPNPETEKSTAEVIPISADVVSGLPDLHLKLDTIDTLKGKYIILPNVSKGHGSVLRRGFYEHYKKMPCVGGYVDGELPNDEGFTSIVNGKDRNYGFKSIAIIQTSDSRKRDHSDLAKVSTWIKWAAPTAEALRQACLARESRISQAEPSLPAIYLHSIQVSNSKFMGPIDLFFSRQFNALIGGRGTGKSTILEYLRWVLCDEPTELIDEDSPDFHKKRKSLIEKTLFPLNAIVTATFIKNGIPHTIRRRVDTQEIVLKIGAGEFQPCKESDVRALLPIQAYSQKQLSNVGIRIEELKRFLTAPLKEFLGDLSARSEELKSNLRTKYELVQRKRILEKGLTSDELELSSLQEQVKDLRAKLKGVSVDDKKIIDDHQQYEKIDELASILDQDLTQAQDAISTALQTFQQIPTHVALEEKMPGREELLEGVASIGVVISDAKQKLMEIAAKIGLKIEGVATEPGDDLKKYKKIAEGIKIKRETHQRQYEEAKKRLSSQEHVIKEISIIESRVTAIQKELLQKKQSLQKISDVKAEYESLRKQWIGIYTARALAIEKKCEECTKLSNNLIKITLKKAAGTSAVEESLRKALSGAKIKSDKIDGLFALIREANDPVSQWNLILDELEKIAWHDSQDKAASLPAVPTLHGQGFIASELERMAEKFSADNWLEVSLQELDDIPKFEYQSAEGQYIDFADASNGQQATALLNLLLNQEGPPLIIDQPEDDLANPEMPRVVQEIWKSKTKRQLIFASHNANIVVNGDAELVVVCNYRVAGDQSGGKIELEGAIDVKPIREAITTVMEGGEEAFKLRKEKYGF